MEQTPTHCWKETLGRYGTAVFSERPKGSTPISLAALAGDATMMRLLADHGADISLAAENGVTPLMQACGVRRSMAELFIPEDDSLAAVVTAVELGADVNAEDYLGDTALHGAARIKSTKIIQYLVQNGADVNRVNKRGQTPCVCCRSLLASNTRRRIQTVKGSGVLTKRNSANYGH